MFNLIDHLKELGSWIVGLVLLLAVTVIGFVWVSIGLYHWLASSLGAIWGPIVLGLVCFIPIVIYALIKAFIRPQPSVQNTSSHGENIDVTLINMSKIFESLSGRSPFIVAAAAIVAGFLVARFPSLLSVFTQILAAYADDVKARAARSADTAESDPTNSH